MKTGSYEITDDPNRVQLDVVRALLAPTYWAGNRPFERTEAAIGNSLPFCVFDGEKQIGFARAITDGHVNAAILDVVIDPAYRGQGIGKRLLRFMLDHPKLKGLRVVLWTTDATEFYVSVGMKHETGFQLLGTIPEWSTASH